MSKATEQKYDDLAVWWNNNYGRHGVEDPNKRWEFLITALRNVIAIQAAIIEDLRKAEGRSHTLYTAAGLKVEL
jgi:hypothetical protein